MVGWSTRRRATVVVALGAGLVLPGAVATAAAPDAPDPALVDRLVGRVAALQHLRPVDLGVPGNSMAEHVSESGVVIGSTYDADAMVTRAFRWRDGVAQLLPDEGRGSEAVAVNVHGQVAAYVHTASGRARAVLWEPDGSVVEIAPGAPWVWPADIDDRGRVAVNVAVLDEGQGTVQETVRAGVWDDGTLTLLELGGVSSVSEGAAMNDRGQVVAVVAAGLDPDSWLPERLVVWDGESDAVTDLSVPPGVVVHPVAVNARGDVLGRLTVDGEARTFTVWEGGRERSVDARQDGWLVDLDDRGVAVGQTQLAGPESAARGIAVGPGRTRLLPTLGGPWSSALAVSGNGLVVGTAQRWGDVRRTQPVLWLDRLPVPLGVRLPGADTVGGSARDVSGRGRVVGDVRVVTGPGSGDQENRAVLWDLLP